MSDGERARLRATAITKSFGGVQALKGADLDARAGEILGLCGENGAGKSTLLKVLSGVFPHGSYGGAVTLDGRELHLRTTDEARRAGIAIVHQELMLVPALSVAANLGLGREPRTALGFLDDERLEAEARAQLDRFGFGGDIDVRRPVGELGIGMQQIVEIVRGLALDAQVLILDEPTAALTSAESDRLMALLGELRARGTTCIYVSHRLDEVFALCDRVTVLRDGRTEGTRAIAGTAPQEIVAMMVGREVETRRPSAPPAKTARPPVIEVVDLTLVPTGASKPAVDGVTIAAHAGEVVALAGALGSGRTAILSALFGAFRGRTVGTVRLDGTIVHLHTPRDAVGQGLALLPEDRKGAGLVLSMTVGDNLVLPSLEPGLLDEAALAVRARATIAAVGVRGVATDLAGAPVATLSGGNQQKVALGKWLGGTKLRVLLLDEPTRGVDVGAREEIYALVEQLAAEGVAVLLASSDLTELLRLAHRVVVLRQGRVAGTLDGSAATQQEIVRLSTGADA